MRTKRGAVGRRKTKMRKWKESTEIIIEPEKKEEICCMHNEIQPI